MGDSCLEDSIMQFFVLLSVIAAAAAAPAPQDESPAALPYVHEEIAAEPYVHDEPVETHDIAAEPYVHEEIAAEPYVHVEPAVAPVVYAAAAPIAYAGYPYAVAAPAYVAYHTGCVNNLGAVVPCAA